MVFKTLPSSRTHLVNPDSESEGSKIGHLQLAGFHSRNLLFWKIFGPVGFK